MTGLVCGRVCDVLGGHRGVWIELWSGGRGGMGRVMCCMEWV